MRILSISGVIFFTLFSFANPVYAVQKKIKIAIIVWRGETEAEKGFKDGLNELGYEVQYAVFDAQQDKSKVGDILRQQLSIDTYDYIYTFGTTVSEQAKGFLKDQTPQIFNIVSDPVKSGLVQSVEASGGNICGVKSGISMKLQIENARKIIPFKKLGFIFNSREKNSNIALDELMQLSEQLNFEVVPLRSPPAQERLENNLQKIIDKTIQVDAVYLPSDSYIISKAKFIASQLKNAKVASVGAVEQYIGDGVLLGIVADYYMLGKQAANIVDQHQKGIPLRNIPIETPKTVKLMLNETTKVALNMEIPNEQIKNAAIVH